TSQEAQPPESLSPHRPSVPPLATRWHYYSARSKSALHFFASLLRYFITSFFSASITINRAVSSIPIAVLSTSTASSARTSGDTLRSRSRLSRSCTSSTPCSSVSFSLSP